MTLSEKRVSQSVLQTTKYNDIKIICIYKAAACVSVCESVMGAATRTNLLSCKGHIGKQWDKLFECVMNVMEDSWNSHEIK